MEITSGRIATAIKTVIYGPEGIGKTTFASQFPDPLFIDTEGSTVHMDVKRLPKPDLWVELLNEVEYVCQNPGCCRTLVLDTADWAETLCSEYVCSRDQKTGIEDYGYGKGYRFLFEEFGRLLNALEQVREKGVNIVICCHAAMRKFEQPDELGAYDRWSLKLTDTPRASIAGAVKEWADMVIFANYKTIVVNVDGKGATKGKNKAQGGKRVMYTAHHSCWDAKNRFGLPEEADFSYEVVRPVIEGAAATTTATPPPVGAISQSPAPPASSLARKVEEATRPSGPKGLSPQAQGRAQDAGETRGQANGAARGASLPQTPAPAPDPGPGPEYAGLPPALVRMMQQENVTPDEVRYVIAQKGYYPADTPWSVITQNTQFMEGWLLHPQVWPQVVNAARLNRKDDPF